MPAPPISGLKTLNLAIVAILIQLGTIAPAAYPQSTTSNQGSGPIDVSAQIGEIRIQDCNIKETLLINGTIRVPITNSPIVVRIDNPNGTVYDSEHIPLSQVSHDGRYRYSLTMTYGNGMPSGPYGITVYYSGYSAKTSMHLILPPIIRAPPPNNIRIADSYGNSLSEIKVGQQVQIEDSIRPVCGEQKFAYVVQVQDRDAVTVSLSWIEGTFVGNRPLNFSEMWTPFDAGNYTIERYLWSSIASPNALQPPIFRTVEVG